MSGPSSSRMSMPAQQLQDMVDAALIPALANQKALVIPSYPVAQLPRASDYPNGTVKIIDNPQGTAQSNGAVWISDVDGSNLGAGNG